MPVDSAARKERSTFVIQIEDRQHATWQGRLTWAEGNRSIPFRSALELLRLIDEALDGDTSPDSPPREG